MNEHDDEGHPLGAARGGCVGIMLYAIVALAILAIVAQMQGW